MADDLTLEIDDETFEALKRMAEHAGLSVEEFATRLLIESVHDQPVQLISDGGEP